MKYLSLCSGIEAASVAWRSLVWQAVAFAEIEPFPCAVLNYHYPDVPNLGDITQIDGRHFRGAVDLVVAGTPCQDFSIAGKRAGMVGERSGLAREFIRLVREINPQWLVWENVPGVFSTNGGRDFGSFIKALDDSGYCCAWRVLDAQFFGVPQRRRRVFVVGYFGDWRPAAKILFESESLHRDFAPRRKTGKEVAGTLKGGSGNRGWTNGAEDNFIALKKTGLLTGTSARGSRDENMVADGFCIPINTQIAMRHQALGERTGLGIGNSDDPAFTLQENHAHAVAFAQNQCGEIRTSEVFGTLNQNSNASGRNTPLLAYAPPIVEQAISCKWAKGSSGPAGDEHHNLITYAPQIAPSMSSSGPPYDRTGNERVEADALVVSKFQVRRLTPKECERLQGFPDNYTNIEYKGKTAADSLRYKALGNSMAVPVMLWLGKRIHRYSNQ